MQQHHIPRVSDVPGVCTMYVCGVASLSLVAKKKGAMGGRGGGVERKMGAIVLYGMG